MTQAVANQKSPAEILRARAKALARPPQRKDPAGPSIEIVEFGLAGERYALETACVREVYPLNDLTPLPGTPPFVAGIIHARGRIVAVIDLKKFFDLPEEGITDSHRVVIVGRDDTEIGVLADFVAGVRSVPLSALQSALPTFSGPREQYLKGVTAERLVVLDAARILADPKIVVEEGVVV
ncbi:MAG: purine-binding chemotaxis protein CheW [Verrucomicrobia bacterium]|nr:purine-binding chemotaxis protein CheW [Verrucomicrobiota bacterium]